MTVSLSNPLDVYANAIAEPLDAAATEWRALGEMHKTTNDNLLQQAHTLAATLGPDVAQAFIDMINKQHHYTAGIIQCIDEIAGFYNKGAELVRDAARIVDSVVNIYFDIVKWVLDRVTPNIIVQEGEAPIRAAFDDLRSTINRVTRDAGGFLGDLFHLDFSGALHAAEDEAKAIAHMAGDAIAIIADVEPILCQWAVELMYAVNWCFNQVNALTLKLEDWVLGISDIASEAAVLSDPNATTAEKALAGSLLVINVGLDILMFIPGAQEAIFGRIAEKLGIKFATRWIVTKISESIVGKLISDFVERLLTKFARDAVERALERKLTQEVFKNIQGDIEARLTVAVQLIIEKFLAGKISQAEARAEIKALETLADKYSSEELKTLFNRFSADDLIKIAQHDINLSDITTLIADNKKFPLSDTNAVKALTGPDGTTSVRIAGADGEGADITFFGKDGSVLLKREVKCIGPGSFSQRLSKAASQGQHAGEVFFQMPEDTNIQSLMDTFRRVRTPEQLAKYKNVYLRVVDPSGKILYDGPVVP
jgi:hypothetical protein